MLQPSFQIAGTNTILRVPTTTMCHGLRLSDYLCFEGLRCSHRAQPPHAAWRGTVGVGMEALYGRDARIRHRGSAPPKLIRRGGRGKRACRRSRIPRRQRPQMPTRAALVAPLDADNRQSSWQRGWVQELSRKLPRRIHVNSEVQLHRQLHDARIARRVNVIERW